MKVSVIVEGNRRIIAPANSRGKIQLNHDGLGVEKLLFMRRG